MVTWVFLIAAATAVVFAVVAVAHRSPVVNVLALVIVFFAVAVVFALLGMDLLAAIQLLVYSGAVLVLFLFVIMLLNLRRVDTLGSGGRIQAVLGAIAALGFGGLVVVLAAQLGPAPTAALPGAAEQGTVTSVGRALVGSHLLAFEAISVLLVAAIVGAVYLARGNR